MLKDLQQEFYANIIKVENCQNYQDSDKFSAKDLMHIYHNHYFTTLKDALSSTYSCVKRLVGEEFFSFLTTQFIKQNPNKTGSMIDYGFGFAEFIKNNEQCQGLPFLSEVVEFEFLYEKCYFSSKASYLKTNYPVLQIWQLDENSANLDLDCGGDYIKIYKNGVEVVVEKITKQEYENATNNYNLQ